MEARNCLERNTLSLIVCRPLEKLQVNLMSQTEVMIFMCSVWVTVDGVRQIITIAVLARSRAFPHGLSGRGI
jgi:hypothetical protein